ncbi:3-hydroxyacyl-CoA dehydrogenase [Lacisediminihabitans profunda]|uniref:3-hydroxyacyl-CoA dehydrogenase n=1 Tax=Lacisediminihabitans profunda TaxID=2594790 RepID=UPI001C9BE83D|nr:3-hydroxyacyl-CoA dehydrogenase [Lacisediminihabitans profunda]
MTRTVAIAGAGSIGVAFALLFARAGFNVRMWDALPGAFDRATPDLLDRLDLLDRFDALHEPTHTIAARVSYHDILLDALDGAELVQECAPESLEIKRELFQQLGAYSDSKTVLASSSSAIVASQFATATPARDRVLIAHPGNPPYLIPVIELVPSPFTSSEIVDRAEQIYVEAGLRPVRVRKEIEGFVFNRLQGALLREAYALVRDGVASVADIDLVVTQGLGRRWSVIGPFETIDLNTRGGVESHAAKMGPAYARMGAERGQDDPWTDELVTEVARQRREQLPLDHWDERVRWRDEQLLRRQVLDHDPSPTKNA